MLFERLRGLALIALRRLDRVRVSFSRSVTDLAAGDVALAGNFTLAWEVFSYSRNSGLWQDRHSSMPA